MSQSPEDLDTLITATFSQLLAAQSLKTALMTLLATAGNAVAFTASDDIITMSRGGLDGNESYTRSGLLARLDAITLQEKMLSDTYAMQVALKQKMFPVIRVHNETNCCRSIW